MVLGYQWIDLWRLAQLAFGMSKSWRFRDHHNGCLKPYLTKPYLHRCSPCLLDRGETTEGPVGLDNVIKCIQWNQRKCSTAQYFSPKDA